eukprot:5411873-Karenia_brevis.AAC.1
MQHMQAICAIANHGAAFHQAQAAFHGQQEQISQENQEWTSTVDPGYGVPCAQMLRAHGDSSYGTSMPGLF